MLSVNNENLRVTQECVKYCILYITEKWLKPSTNGGGVLSYSQGEKT